ncbi:MAG: NAD(P)/FAD-dependent oxidoreductase [Phycisphaerales bacterium]
MVSNGTEAFDVAIIGGGPAGSTAGSLIRKYNPKARVVILEREKFPREHVGESQLPVIGQILDEMGCWDKVESANFPIKIGGTYRWGSSPELWDFEFIPIDRFSDEERPAPYHGQRLFTALQVERAIYDDILLNHAAELGCEVREETKVTKIHRDGDTIEGIELDGGGMVRAKYYLDASGAAGIIRRTMDIPVYQPKHLKNMAMWDYWENADWAIEIGIGGTRIQVLSIGTGWVWFIPLGPTRTSIGFICPVEHYKASGKTPDELYHDALSKESRVQALTRNATSEGKVRTTKDWSYVAERLAGPNWFLVGESSGFADPILSSGMTLAQRSAKEVAYTVLELLRDPGEHDPKWLREQYDVSNRGRIRQYIRFAEYWYAANGQFTDLESYSAEIARDAGLDLSPKQAFRWLSQGGLSHEDQFFPGIGGLDLFAVKELSKRFTPNADESWEVNKYNVLKLNLVGAKRDTVAHFHKGRIHRVECYRKGGHILPLFGAYKPVVELLKRTSDLMTIFQKLDEATKSQPADSIAPFNLQAIACIETMLSEGWIQGKINKKRPRPTFSDKGRVSGTLFHDNTDPLPATGTPRRGAKAPTPAAK